MDMEKPGARKRRELSSSGKAIKDTPFQQKKPKSKKSKKKEQQAAQDHDEERRLTSLLFGGGSSDLPASQVEKERKDEEVAAPFSFEIDRTGISEVHEDGDRNVARSFNEAEEEGNGKTEESGVAWVDEDDADLEVDLLGTSRLRKLRKSKTEEAASALNGVELEQRLRQRYQNSTQAAARTDWANLDEKVDPEDQSDVEDGALQSSSAPLVLQGSANQRLPPNILNIMRCPDANLADPNKSVVQAVNFHPGSDPERPLLLTAGLDKTLRFFQVGAEKSEKVHGIHCKFLSMTICRTRSSENFILTRHLQSQTFPFTARLFSGGQARSWLVAVDPSSTSTTQWQESLIWYPRSWDEKRKVWRNVWHLPMDVPLPLLGTTVISRWLIPTPSIG
jgi:hypothetical protein